VSAPVVPTLTVAARDLPDWEPNPFLFGLEAKKREETDVVPVEYPIAPKPDPLLGLQEQAGLSRTPDGFSALLRDFPGQASGSSPPDATGAVGRHHYVQVVNQSVSTVRVLDKVTGANLKTFTMQSLAAGAPCSSGFCDPVVVYDSMADRWLIAELPSSGGQRLHLRLHLAGPHRHLVRLRLPGGAEPSRLSQVRGLAPERGRLLPHGCERGDEQRARSLRLRPRAHAGRTPRHLPGIQRGPGSPTWGSSSSFPPPWRGPCRLPTASPRSSCASGTTRR
jgi:hypothetical protein